MKFLHAFHINSRKKKIYKASSFLIVFSTLCEIHKIDCQKNSARLDQSHRWKYNRVYLDVCDEIHACSSMRFKVSPLTHQSSHESVWLTKKLRRKMITVKPVGYYPRYSITRSPQLTRRMNRGLFLKRRRQHTSTRLSYR